MIYRHTSTKSILMMAGKAMLLCAGLILVSEVAFAGQMTALNYSATGHERNGATAVKQETISGTVTDASTGETLPGVNISVKGTTTGTSTNSSGQFKLTVESLQDTLTFSFIGYEAQEVAISGRTSIDVALNSTTVGLEEMVVVGFGEQSKRNIVGSVSSVKMESMEKVHASTFNQKLQGKISGVNVTTSSGRLGAPVKINIRGTTSINASSQPLYVVDGVPIVNNSLGEGGGVYGSNAQINPFINLSSDNIKSIDVLKDASAAAIYGTRGSNGVILITTKSGTEGQQELSFNVSGGISRPTKKLNLLNGPEYIDVYNYKNNTDYNPSDFANTNWQDEVSQTGSFQKYDMSFSGGTKNSTYYLSGGYENAKGIILTNSLEKFDTHIKGNHDFNDRLSVGLSTSPSVTQNSSLRAIGQVGTAFGFAVLEPPVIPKFLPDGSVNDGRDPTVQANALFSPFPGTPYANLKYMDFDNTTKQVLTNADINYDILSNLTFKSSFGYQFLDNQVNNRFQNNTVGGYPNGVVGVSTHTFTNASWNNTLTYKTDWENNSLEVILGATLEKNANENSSLTKRNIPVNQLTDLDSAAEIVGGSGASTSYVFQNNVARISYSYKDRYLLTLTGSYDGTSRFAEGQRYGFFPAVAAGWILSDESFMENFKAVSFLKLRASYGVVGNANIGNFEYLPLLSANVSYFNEPGLNFNQLANLNLTWETGNEYDIALDYGFLDNRINGKIEYYNKITTNLLLSRRVSNINGFTSIFENGGKMSNHGVEFDFNVDIFRMNNLQWSINGNIATLQNEVKDLPGGQIIDSPNIVKEGEPIASFYMPVYKGVDPESGDALYDDGNGGTTANYSVAPRKIVGSPTPKLYGGFGTNFSFKNLDFSVDFNYTYGNKLYRSDAQYVVGGSSGYNREKASFDYWTPDNTNAANPEPRLAPNGNSTSTRFLEDGTYLRFKSFQIGYTISSNLMGAKNIRVYVGGTNLATFTTYSGFDPEGTTSATSNISQGVVNGNDPPSLTINGGIQIRM